METTMKCTTTKLSSTTITTTILSTTTITITIQRTTTTNKRTPKGKRMAKTSTVDLDEDNEEEEHSRHVSRWTREEEILLCQCWVEVSENNDIGDGRKEDSFWGQMIHFGGRLLNISTKVVHECRHWMDWYVNRGWWRCCGVDWSFVLLRDCMMVVKEIVSKLLEEEEVEEDDGGSEV
ncbi:hypothetical protein Tco_0618233 [Tanacetum coccineum]